jgi:hypothetical protein
MKSFERDFPTTLNIKESILHPPSGEEFEAFLDLIVGATDNGPLPLTAVENEQKIPRRDWINYIKASSESSSQKSRKKKSNDLHDGLGTSYFTQNQVHPLETSEDLQYNISCSLPAFQTSEIENFTSSKIFGEAQTPETRHFFDPDELRSLDVPNSRLLTSNPPHFEESAYQSTLCIRRNC